MKRFLTYVSVIILALSCTKEDFTIENLNNDQISIFGHGGMGIENTYPMNSYESILNCLNMGADGSEMDVQMTKDSVLVAFHDFNLSEKTNIEGVINSLNWEEVNEGHYTNAPYQDYSILSLDNIFSNLNNINEYQFTFDCKLYTENPDLEKFHTVFSNALINLIDKYDIENNVLVESGSIDLLRQLHAINENLKLFIYPDNFEEGLDIAKENDLYGITMSTKIISKEQIELAHNDGFFVAIWNIQSRNENIEAINKNPDFIQTDELRNLIKLLD